LRLLFVTTSLGTGGAERMLVKLVAALRRRGCSFLIVSLRDAGTQTQPLRELGATVEELRMDLPWRLPAVATRFRRRIVSFAPDVIQGWMYHGNLAATLGVRLARSSAPLLWGVRQTFQGMGNERPLTRFVIRANARFSMKPRCILFNSGASLQQHSAIGFRTEHAQVIPNGFELDRFRPDDRVREATRTRLGISADKLVVGHVARDHPMKDHETLLRAAKQVVASFPQAMFVLVGRGIDPSNPRLARLIAQLDLARSVRALGEVADLEALYPAFDLSVLSSAWGEAFPNVLGEAMACAVPCVATDVGEAAEIIGDRRRIVAPAQPEALARAITLVLQMDTTLRREIGVKDRERVATRFSLDAIAEQYWRLYADACAVRQMES
jgi:glycosyltransferase involved in cell wall biosynthesis